MPPDDLSQLLSGIDLSVATLAERAGLEARQIDTLRGGHGDLPAGARERLAREIRAHAAALERVAAGVERAAAAAQPTLPPAPRPAPLAHAESGSKVRIAVGAVGLLMFIVGVRRFGPGRPGDAEDEPPSSFGAS